MDLELFKVEDRAISHGTCAGIGIGGHLTHGGYGQSSQNWAVALDSIVAMRVVIANGTIVKANTLETTDL